MSCASCGAGFHGECYGTKGSGRICCCSGSTESSELDIKEDVEDSYGSWRGGRRNATLRDQQSTGRKRAAALYPLSETESCEWKGLRFAGGGKYPIVGCRNGTQQARHHGPDKNTLNNDEGNVHRICHTCHNRWHAKNDPDYEAGVIPHKHDPETLFTDDEWLESEMYFTRNTPKKVGRD